MKLEILEKNNFYHIYNRGINGTPIFTSDENKRYFLIKFEQYLSNKISVFAYCLMDNHFHFVVQIDEDEKIITQAFSNFFNAYAKAFNKENNRTGSLFEKHFKRIKLNDESYLRNLIIYTHLNPKHHFDLDFTAYRFSSYQSFISDKETKLKRKEVIGLFGDVENFIYCHHQKNNFLTEKYTLE